MFGVMQAVGGLVIALFVMLLIHPDAMGKGWKLFFIALWFVGSVGMGVCARDNDKSSEDVRKR